MNGNDAFRALLFLSPTGTRAIVIAAIPIVVLLLIVLYRNREGTVATPAAPAPGAPARTSHWVAGMFYVNPDDPAILVRKRYGYGWTFNFGHWVSWLVLAVPVVIAVLAALENGRH